MKLLIPMVLLAFLGKWLGVEQVFNIGDERLLWQLRNALGFAPQLDQRLKIYLADSVTGSESPFWEGIAALQSRQPRAILVAVHGQLLRDETFPQWSAALAGAAPVFLLAEYHQTRENDGPRLDRRFLRTLAESPGREMKVLRTGEMDWRGFSPAARDVIRGVGHVLFGDQHGIRPLVQVGPQAYLRYFALLPFSNLAWPGESNAGARVTLPITEQGTVLINAVHGSELEARIKSFSTIVNRLRLGLGLQEVHKGDIVVILPKSPGDGPVAMISPFSDWRSAVISTLNSALSGAWLAPIQLPFSVAWIIGVSIGVALGMLSGSWLWLWLWAGGILALWVALCLTLYLGFGYVLQLHLMSVALLIGILGKSFMALLTWRQQGSGAVRPSGLGLRSAKSRLDSILEQPQETEVAVLAVELSGLSYLISQSSSLYTQEVVRSICQALGAVVHRHGGKIDHFSGDGFLAYFGYHALSGEHGGQFVDDAIRCAIEMQNTMLSLNMRAVESHACILPSRIGIATARVVFGNLDLSGKTDIALISDDLKFLRLLQAACPPFLINMSEDVLRQSECYSQWDPAIEMRGIPLNHRQQGIAQVFELDPLMERREEASQVIQEYRKSMRLVRESDRIWVKNNNLIEVYTNYGPACIVDFSKTGISLLMDSYLAEGLDIHLEFDSQDGRLKKMLEGERLQQVVAKIMWGRRSKAGYKHGLRYTSLSPEQMQSLYGILRMYLGMETPEDENSQAS